MSKTKVTLKYAEESLNELGCPEHDHPEFGGRVSWRMVNKYGTWLRRNDPQTFHIYRRELEEYINEYK